MGSFLKMEQGKLTGNLLKYKNIRLITREWQDILWKLNKKFQIEGIIAKMAKASNPLDSV